MLISVDGKISTGDTDAMDVDKDFPKIIGVKEGLDQYYDIEKKTDLYSLNSGKVQAKIGANEKKENVEKTPVHFIVIDNKPHLNEQGVDYFIKKSKKFFLITTNKNHPAFKRKDEVEILYYENKIHFEDLFRQFKEKYGVENITIQTGGTMNAVFLRKGLIDHISIVVAPCLIGGENTPTLIDGESLHLQEKLKYVKALKLMKCELLKNSYIHLTYNVING